MFFPPRVADICEEMEAAERGTITIDNGQADVNHDGFKVLGQIRKGLAAICAFETFGCDGSQLAWLFAGTTRSEPYLP